MRTFPWVWPFLLLAACSPTTPHGDDDSQAGGPDAGAEDCPSAGATRCQGQEYQSCQNGSWTTTDTCLAPSETCYQGFGCAECAPTSAQVCVGNDVHTCENGRIGDLVMSCGALSCNGGSCGASSDCDESTQVIYVVDRQYNLLSFDPRHDANTFHLIGQLNCPAGPPWPAAGLTSPTTPFSMSVDRLGRAWVLYTSGEIFLVSTADASCQPSGFVKGAEGFQLFGMGFVSDTMGGDSETLYIVGGDAATTAGLPDGMANLGTIDASSYTTSKLGQLGRRAELTGTGNGELWGYLPPGFFTPGLVAKLDRTTGATLRSYNLPAPDGLVDDFAFAHYGGRYYIFLTAGSQQVLRLDPAGNGGAGQVVTVVPNSPYEVVGAGVSTCAPVIVP